MTPAQLRQLWQAETCSYCTTPLTPEARPSLDRLDPARGYTAANVVMACYRCNRRKQDSSPHDLRALADGIDRLMEARGFSCRLT